MIHRSRRHRPIASALLLLLAGGLALAFMNARRGRDEAAAAQAGAAEAAKGRDFIAARSYSAEEDRAILKLFEGLRVADVSDGMDAVGLQDVGLMDPAIAPLWRDT